MLLGKQNFGRVSAFVMGTVSLSLKKANYYGYMLVGRCLADI